MLQRGGEKNMKENVERILYDFMNCETCEGCVVDHYNAVDLKNGDAIRLCSVLTDYRDMLLQKLIRTVENM